MKLEKILKTVIVIGALIGLPTYTNYICENYKEREPIDNCIGNMERQYSHSQLTPERQNQIIEYCEWKILKKTK